MRHHLFRLLLRVMCIGTLAVSAPASAAPFTPGNLALYRVGDGSAALTTGGTPVFIDEYTPGGTLVQSLPLPVITNGSQRALVASGTATTEGMLSRSSDGNYLWLTGYATAVGTPSLASTLSAAVPRVAGRIDAVGNVNTTTALSDFSDAGNPRSAASDSGSRVWLAGATGGTRYATLGATTSVALAPAPAIMRQTHIAAGQLYATTGAVPGGVYAVGSGLPTAPGQIPTLLAATTSPNAVFIVPSLQTMYVADDMAAHILKFAKQMDGTWAAAGSIAATGVRGLTGTVAGPVVTLFATSPGTLYTAVDNTGAGTASGTATATALASANTAFRGIALAPEWVPGPLRIHDLQGTEHRSPSAAQVVANVPGIVTQVVSNGFYLQDPMPDADDRTSEGLFVFTASAPTVQPGDSLLVSGTLAEFATGSTNLAITEITTPTILKLGSGNALPPPALLGAGGRPLPAAAVWNGGGIDLNTTSHPLDLALGIDFFESLEGMRVVVNDALVVGPTNAFGETPVIVDSGVAAGLRTVRGGMLLRADDANPEIVIVQDPTPNPTRYAVGTRFNQVIGVITYSLGTYRVLRDTTLPFNVDAAQVPAKEATSLAAGPGRLTIASHVSVNLAPGDGAPRFTAVAADIVERLASPDIVVVHEIQDSNGTVNDGTVDATTTLTMLTNAIAAAGGPTYAWRNIDPADDADGGVPGGNIRSVFLFNPVRVSFNDRPGGAATVATTIIDAGGMAQLSTSPGRINPTDPAWNSSRKPLVGEFVFAGRTVFVVAVHFNSKGGDSPLYGRQQPPTLPSETQRTQQATLVQSFVGQILAVEPAARIVVVGDVNDYEYSAPFLALKGGTLAPLIERLPQNERYTFQFNGNSQALDHVLVSGALLPGALYDIVHFGAEYPAATTDHDPVVARLRIPACVLDLDGDGVVNPMTDGVMWLRLMFGLSGDAVTANALPPMPPRPDWAAIAPWVSLAPLDIDGDGVVDPLTDGLILMRALLGARDDGVVAKALGNGATRTSWSAVRDYLNGTCETSFAP